MALVLIASAGSVVWLMARTLDDVRDANEAAANRDELALVLIEALQRNLRRSVREHRGQTESEINRVLEFVLIIAERAGIDVSDLPRGVENGDQFNRNLSPNPQPSNGPREPSPSPTRRPSPSPSPTRSPRPDVCVPIIGCIGDDDDGPLLGGIGLSMGAVVAAVAFILSRRGR